MEKDATTLTVETIINDNAIPKVYANGFYVSTALSDFIIVSQLNGQPTQVMNVSYTSLKSLGEAIKTTVDDFEKKTKTKLLTINQIRKALVEKT